MLLSLVRGLSNHPVIGHQWEWKDVTFAEYERVIEQYRRSREWQSVKDALNLNSGLGCAAVLGVLALSGGVFFVLKGISPMLAGIWGADVLILLLPLWLSGFYLAWEPIELISKIATLQNVREFLREEPHPRWELTPMLEIATNHQGKQVPLDARLMLRRKKAPQGFIGIQVQVAINRGEPYLYSVILAFKGFGLPELIPSGAAGKDLIEVQPDSEVEVIVVRQETSDNGYWTDEEAQRRLLFRALELAERAIEAKE